MENTVSFWDDNHPRQSEYKRMEDAYVPAQDKADTVYGELIRCASNLMHEFGNNGNCNALEIQSEECPECYGSGYEEVDYGDDEIEERDCSCCDGNCSIDGDRLMDDHFGGMLNYIRDNVKDSDGVCQAVECLITGDKNYNYSYNQEEMDVYNKLLVICLDAALELESA